MRSLEGQAESLKERTIATEVFGRREDYLTGEDSVVRVRASEVRKRLAQFYEGEGAGSPIRIERPLGSYVPQFVRLPASAPGEMQPDARRGPLWGRRTLLAGVAVTLAGIVGLFVGLGQLTPNHRSPLEQFWQPMFTKQESVVIFLPILRVSDRESALTERVGVGAAHGAIRLATLVTRLGHSYRIKTGPDLTFDDLRRQPAILLGAYSWYWTAEMNRGLRFTFRRHDARFHILDNQSGQTWHAVGEKLPQFADEDYALVSRLFDSQTGRILIMAAGITTFGTQSAAESLSDSEVFAKLIKHAPPDWPSKNFQMILHTRVIGMTPGAPKLVASHFW